MDVGGVDQPKDPEMEDDKSLTKMLELIYRLHGDDCKRAGCEEKLLYEDSFVGTCLVVKWKCAAGHFGGRWASQPTCANIRVGNLLLASAIALSGNSFTKIGFLFKVMNMKFISKNLYNQYQNLFIAPVVEKYWEDKKEELWKERERKDTILSSDGRNDSPATVLNIVHIHLQIWKVRPYCKLILLMFAKWKGEKATTWNGLHL